MLKYVWLSVYFNTLLTAATQFQIHKFITEHAIRRTDYLVDFIFNEEVHAENESGKFCITLTMVLLQRKYLSRGNTCATLESLVHLYTPFSSLLEEFD